MSNSAQGIVKTAATFTGTVRARKHRIALYDSDGERLSYDGLADYQVLDGEGLARAGGLRDRFVRHVLRAPEGDVGVHPHYPYAISYGSIIPKKEECTNLLVPVCVSSTHIAFGSIRMEPVFMILGQSAAAAASLCIDHDIPLQELDYNLLKEKLLAGNVVLRVR